MAKRMSWVDEVNAALDAPRARRGAKSAANGSAKKAKSGGGSADHAVGFFLGVLALYFVLKVWKARRTQGVDEVTI